MVHVDMSLHSQGLVDVTVGVVGLERLKKTAQIPQVLLNVPTLSRLVPFLEVSQNQEYVVSRIKGMCDPCWVNETGSVNNVWSRHALVM